MVFLYFNLFFQYFKGIVEFRIFIFYLFILVLAGPLEITAFIVKAERATLVK